MLLTTILAGCGGGSSSPPPSPSSSTPPPQARLAASLLPQLGDLPHGWVQLQGIVTAARDRTVLSCTGDLAVMSGFQASVNSPLFGQEKKGKSVKELSGSVNIAKSAADASKEVSALGHSAARLCLQRSLQSSIEGSLPATVKSVRVQVATTSVPGVPSGGVTYRENVYATVSGPEHLAGIGVVTFFAVGRMSATVNALSLGQPSSPASEVTAAVKSMVARARRAGV